MEREFALYSRPLTGNGPWTPLVRDTNPIELFRLKDRVTLNASSGLLAELAIADFPWQPLTVPFAQPADYLATQAEGAEDEHEHARRTR